MIFNVVLDAVDLNDVFPEMVVLNICYLSVFVLLLSQVEQMIGLHFFDDLDESIVEG